MATLKNAKILEHFNDFSDSWVKGAVENYPEVEDGFFELPEEPGLGIKVNRGFLESHQALLDNGIIQDPGLNMYEFEEWNKRSKRD